MSARLRLWVGRISNKSLAFWRGQTSMAVLIVALVGIAFAVTGAGSDVERGMAAWRAAHHSRAATGQLALVEIDARSLAALDHWPWRRTIYVDAIRQLNRLGAKTIAFDVDFSSRTSEHDDNALAAALEASTVPILLPTFRQATSLNSAAISENLPLPILRRNSMLASVNIRADADSLVRSYPYAVTTSSAPRPSIGAMLGNAAGFSETSFPIDNAIDPATVPHVSFVDLVQGRVPAETIRGRSILIGATAVELGDRYSVPGRGVIPGPLIQLLAGETLLQQSSPVDHGAALGLLLALLTVMLATCLRGKREAMTFCGGMVALLMLPYVSEVLRLGTFEVVPALGAVGCAWITSVIFSAIRAAREARLIDDETGLPNLRSFEMAVTEAAPAAVIVYRLANHGDIVSISGHGGASNLVSQMADRLRAATGQAAHRIEENALAWMSFNETAEQQVSEIDDVAALLRLSFFVSGRKVEAEGGFGIADHVGTSDSVGRATVAADRAIIDGERWVRHSEALGQRVDHRLRIIGEIDTAIADGQLWVAYQPKLHIGSGEIRSSEALVRWKHPELGAIPPDAFIPALEESGRIKDLTLYVVETALGDQAKWAANGVNLGTAVNISARLPADPDFVSRLQAVLDRFPDQAPNLTLEVTESAALTDPTATVLALEKLAALGVRLSIDDYGTGQSTLSYLKRLPAREIKIDKSFVQNIVDSKGDQAMVRSTIDLAHELGFCVVAEGIETEACLSLLASFGCDYGQGWQIGKPMPAADLFAMIAKLGRGGHQPPSQIPTVIHDTALSAYLLAS